MSEWEFGGIKSKITPDFEKRNNSIFLDGEGGNFYESGWHIGESSL